MLTVLCHEPSLFESMKRQCDKTNCSLRGGEGRETGTIECSELARTYDSKYLV
jgi:hypothetical protein